jgi:hypothetical protein
VRERRGCTSRQRNWLTILYNKESSVSSPASSLPAQSASTSKAVHSSSSSSSSCPLYSTVSRVCSLPAQSANTFKAFSSSSRRALCSSQHIQISDDIASDVSLPSAVGRRVPVCSSPASLPAHSDSACVLSSVLGQHSACRHGQDSISTPRVPTRCGRKTPSHPS